MESVTSATGEHGIPVCHVVTPVGMMGYGFDEKLTETALESLVATGTPTAIILDSGSTDSGPEKLALGVTTCPRSSYYRDLSKLLKLVYAFHVPLIFSSAGGDGSDDHVREISQIIEEIVLEKGNEHYRFQIIAIFAGIDKAIVMDRLRKGSITGCGKFVPPLTETDIENATTIVSQLGPEPFLDAMEANPDFDVIVGGRAYDPAPYVAYAAHLMKSQLANASSKEKATIFGSLQHMGKIMECGGLCSDPKSYGAVATVYDNGTFDIVPTLPTSRCTPLSVAAHTLYEKSRPDLLYGPGGWLDLTKSTYEQMSDGRTVRVSGSTFHFSEDNALPYQLKLEAATIVGYRSMYMGTIRDPIADMFNAGILVRQIDPLLEQVRSYITAQHPDISDWDIHWHIHGKDELGKVANDIFLVGEVLASTQAQAKAIASTARVGTMHGSYEGQKATSGNFGFGIGGKVEIDLGPCAKFSVYHLMDLKEGEKHLFLPGNEQAASKTRSEAPGVRILHTVSTIGRGENMSTPRPVSNTTKKEKPLGDLVHPEGSQTKTTPQAPPNKTSENQPAPSVLGDIARVLRSKNSGPYEITLDAMFETEATYQSIKKSSLLSEESVATALGVSRDHIVWCGFFDPARAFKVTIPRIRGGKLVSAGGFMEDDVHGSQQHLELYNMKLPDELLAQLAT
ncbi:hypothetical protein PG993_007439 [Apiospora rasikravindrae]|uniref:Caib baif family enzyme n=1 Tax=Apiospora rasikravindrae TaxID=990691 RepID=A0ABR1SXI7_9PEZI